MHTGLYFVLQYIILWVYPAVRLERHTFITAQFIGLFDEIIIEFVLLLDNNVKTIDTL
jgi:predicted transporter